MILFPKSIFSIKRILRGKIALGGMENRVKSLFNNAFSCAYDLMADCFYFFNIASITRAAGLWLLFDDY
jgi:hypothetical protein